MKRLLVWYCILKNDNLVLSERRNSYLRDFMIIRVWYTKTFLDGTVFLNRRYLSPITYNQCHSLDHSTFFLKNLSVQRLTIVPGSSKVLIFSRKIHMLDTGCFKKSCPMLFPTTEEFSVNLFS